MLYPIVKYKIVHIDINER